jgi:hypothetical protein
LLKALEGWGGACLTGKGGKGEVPRQVRHVEKEDGETTLTTVDMYEWLTFN